MSATGNVAASSATDLTAEDVAGLLRRVGIPGMAARSLTVTRPREQGVAGRALRVTLAADARTAGAPASFFLKFPAPPGPTRDLALRLNLYARERQFYAHIGQRAGVPVPRCYGSAADDDGVPVLVLEDLGEHVAGDLVSGCTLEQAASVVRHLAAMHARWWGDPALEAMAWLPRPVDALDLVGAGTQTSADAWAAFKARFGRDLPAAVLRLGDATSRNAGVLRELSAPPATLVHGDLRANNVLFSAGAGHDVAAFIDWQTAVRGRGPVDVAMFFVTSLAPDVRRAAEATLLPEYHARLLDAGVRGYRLEDCRRDYGLAVINHFSEIVFLAAAVGNEPSVADEVGAVTGARLVQALRDLDLIRLLPGGGPPAAPSARLRRLVGGRIRRRP